ncbi:transposase [Iodobacter sp. BJB302]|nr:transposase [Iodobacter sp. BJB302]
MSKVYQRQGRTIASVAQGLNLPQSTLKGWMAAAKKSQMVLLIPSAKRPEDWSIEERLLALQQSHGLAEIELNAWCRQQGLFAHHLTQWRADFCVPPVTKTDKVDAQALRELKKTNQQLQRELNRKDKALAEAAALLILQKKFNAYLEGADE